MNKKDILELYQQTLTTLESQTQPLQALYRDEMQCKKGCSSCCTARFEIRPIEWDYIDQQLQLLPPETQARIKEQALSAPLTNQCPLLIEDSCSVYSHRPVLCRAYGLLIQAQKTVSTCPLNFQSATTEGAIQVLDLEPYFELLDELSLRLSPKQQKQSIRGFILSDSI